MEYHKDWLLSSQKRWCTQWFYTEISIWWKIKFDTLNNSNTAIINMTPLPTYSYWHATGIAPTLFAVQMADLIQTGVAWVLWKSDLPQYTSFRSQAINLSPSFYFCEITINFQPPALEEFILDFYNDFVVALTKFSHQQNSAGFGNCDKSEHRVGKVFWNKALCTFRSGNKAD